MRKKLGKIKIEILESLYYNGKKTIERLRGVSFGKNLRSRTVVQKHIDEMIKNGMIKTVRFQRRGAFAYDTLHYGLTTKGHKIASNLPNVMNSMRGTEYVDNWISITKRK